MTSRLSPRMAMREDAHELFHEFSQIFPTLNEYTELLVNSPLLVGKEKEAVEELWRIIRVLEDDTEALRARVLAMIG